MDSIKKKMEKLANETAEAEARIAHFEDIKSANEAEAERYEEHVRLGEVMSLSQPETLALLYAAKAALEAISLHATAELVLPPRA